METHLIQSKIYTIRGQKVMLDHDLAELYGVETKVLNQAAKRNIDRFPEDFMFQLTENEWEYLRSQIVTSKKGRGGVRYLPLAFTEQGVAMLSGVLTSKVAIEMNISIMRVFVTIRQALTAPQQTDRYEELKRYMEDILLDQNDINEDTRMQLELINQSLAELQADKRFSNEPRRKIGFRTNDE
jgi:hypothetical protein